MVDYRIGNMSYIDHMLYCCYDWYIPRLLGRLFQSFPTWPIHRLLNCNGMYTIHLFSFYLWSSFIWYYYLNNSYFKFRWHGQCTIDVMWFSTSMIYAIVNCWCCPCMTCTFEQCTYITYMRSISSWALRKIIEKWSCSSRFGYRCKIIII